jgi:hypothetical protein
MRFWRRPSPDGVHVDELPVLTRLQVRTRNTTYDVTVVSPDTGEVIIHGGRFFREPTRGQVMASSPDGRLRQARAIFVGMVVELQTGGRRFQTSHVESIANVTPA